MSSHRRNQLIKLLLKLRRMEFNDQRDRVLSRVHSRLFDQIPSNPGRESWANTMYV